MSDEKPTIAGELIAGVTELGDALAPKHTPGPWMWNVSRISHRVHLVGGSPKYDQTVMDFVRYGMGNAQPRFVRSWVQYMNVMEKAHDLAEVIPGREHHEDWCRTLNTPDARLIASAPDLLAACEAMHRLLAQEYAHAVMNGYFPDVAPILKQGADAIAKATGTVPAGTVGVPDVDSDADE